MKNKNDDLNPEIPLKETTDEIKNLNTVALNVLDSCGLAVISCMSDGSIVILNKNVKRLFLPSSLKLSFNNIGDFDKEWPELKLADHFMETLKHGQKNQLNNKIKNNNETVDLNIQIIPVAGDDGKIKYVNFLISDVSDLKNISGSEVSRAKMVSSLTALNTLLSALAHFFVNSISAISATGQLARMENEYYQKFLEVTMFQANKMIDVLNELNDLNLNIKERTRNFGSGLDTLSDFENEINTFRESFERKKKKDESASNYTFQADDKKVN
jgi:nitrogen-specific signal transduction histidine kinase